MSQLPGRQTLLAQIEASLGEQPDLPPAGREAILKRFAEAWDEQANRPPPASGDVLANWLDAVGTLNSLVESLQRNEKMSATEASDLSRQFDEVTQTLQELHERGQGRPAQTAAAAPPSPGLPQGVPANLTGLLGGK